MYQADFIGNVVGQVLSLFNADDIAVFLLESFWTRVTRVLVLPEHQTHDRLTKSTHHITIIVRNGMIIASYHFLYHANALSKIHALFIVFLGGLIFAEHAEHILL